MDANQPAAAASTAMDTQSVSVPIKRAALPDGGTAKTDGPTTSKFSKTSKGKGRQPITVVQQRGGFSLVTGSTHFEFEDPLSDLLHNFIGGPTPLQCYEEIELDDTSFVPYIRLLYHFARRLFDPTEGYPGLITEQNFVYTVRYLMKARIHYVYYSAIGVRLANPIRFTITEGVLKPLAILLNQIGCVPLPSRGITIVPSPAPEPQVAAHQLVALVTPEVLTQFWQFNLLASNSGQMMTETVSRDKMGSPVWLLGAYTVAAPLVPAILADPDVVIRSKFMEFEPNDAMYAAIYARGVDCLPPNEMTRFRSGTISNMPLMRNSFFQHCVRTN
jgi:hypothetical protein